ncbi:peroxisomal biogenesis factor 11 [Aspergillus cavernicola]|uniref:Peroxisomal biogenesis factor 11 n=1 Tax=Aspergillus cavernicola TaxID=176166 RepID=A0ABR4I8L2_9EURO
MAPAISPMKQLIAFTSQTAGLEKSLRLIQAVSQVSGELSNDKTIATQWLTARDQLALGRRFFRLLDFYQCFERVHELIASTSSSGTLLSVMELSEYTFLGLYLLLENLTILHDMDVSHVEWYTPLMTEANKFWFYAIILSIARASWELFFAPGPSKGSGKNVTDKKGRQTPSVEPSSSTWPLVKQIIIDSCDLTLPGSFVGWVPATGLQIGIAMIISTALAGHNIWVAQR